MASATKRSRTDGTGPDGTARSAPRFRNYVPVDEELKTGMMTPPKAPSVELAERLKAEDKASAAAEKDAPLNIAPKKPNWDLKRDVQRKMDRLNVRTQRAIADLIRARLAKEAAAEAAGATTSDQSELSRSHQFTQAVMKAGEDAGDDEDMD